MASLIPGYEYDIFISYRQKDNKYDGWVTEFVSNLQKELDATFKESISIYFDENPHDGVAEYHNVDDSLAEKLKCLVFIPVVSRTYCDPKSFAWKHEFEVFTAWVSKDPLGPKVKLSNGNVANRILPVRIHDLEKDDIVLFQSFSGSPMRCIDFVYRNAGVNRPLRSQEEHPDENQNHVIYRDQINKVANAVKEIIGGLLTERSFHGESVSVRYQDRESHTFRYQPGNSARKNIAWVSGILISVLLVAYLIFYLISEKGNSPSHSTVKSIAVLPFENLSGDPEQEYFSDGVAEEILIALAQIKDLKVAGRTSSFRFKGKMADLHDIGQQLKVNTILEGSVRRQGQRVKISAKLLNVADGYQLWSGQFERTLDDVFDIQEEIAVAISQRLKVTLLEDESLRISGSLSRNNQAYDAVLRGRFFWDKRELKESERYFKQAIELDSNFASAYAGLAETYVIAPFFRTGVPKEALPRAEAAAKRAIQIDQSLTRPYFTIAFKKANFDWDRQEAGEYFRKAFLGNVNYAPGYYWHAQYLYNFEGDFEKAVSQMRKAVEIEPLGTYAYLNLGKGLLYAKKYEEALHAYRFSIQLNGHNPLAYLDAGFCNIGLEKWDDAQKDFETAASQSSDWAKAMLVYFYLKRGDKQAAQKIFDELTAPDRTEYVSQYILSLAASFLGKKDLAYQYFKKAFEERDPWLPYLINLPVRLVNDVLQDPRNIALMTSHFPWFNGEVTFMDKK